jgi:hypothetical protein
MAPALNGVFSAWDAKEAVRVVGGDVAPSQQHLEVTQKAYTKEVEALQGPAGEELQLLLLQEYRGFVRS